MTRHLTKFAIGLSAAALAIGGIAVAQAPDTPPPPLEDGFHMDANGDGTVTRAEAQAAAEALFTKLDVNKDGKLDKADREARRAQMREDMFKRLDTNGDGVISKAEFLADRGPEGRGPGGKGPMGGPEGRPDMPPPPPEDGPDMAPPPEGGPDAQAAPGKDGPRGHGPRRHGPRFGGPGSMRGPMSRMGDADKDGAVTKAEFIAAALSRFDAMDANHDGKVTKEERQAARRQMRDERRGPPEGDGPPPPPAQNPAK